MTNKKKLLLAVACMALAVCSLVTGTLAWLTAETDTVINTFAPSNIKLTLTETWNAKSNESLQDNDIWKVNMIPGSTYTKDPEVTVTTDIACYVFVKVQETGSVTVGNTTYNFGDFMGYAVAAGWIELDGQDGVYYREIAENEAKNGTTFNLLGADLSGNAKWTENQVYVKETVTNDMMNALINADVQPTLTFTAYAIQSANLPDQNGDGNKNAVDAWLLCSNP